MVVASLESATVSVVREGKTQPSTTYPAGIALYVAIPTAVAIVIIAAGIGVFIGRRNARRDRKKHNEPAT